MNQYEAMFVFDPTFGGAFEKCEAEIGRLMERAGGEIIICRKWDERRLAYRINSDKPACMRLCPVWSFRLTPPDLISHN